MWKLLLVIRCLIYVFQWGAIENLIVMESKKGRAVVEYCSPQVAVSTNKFLVRPRLSLMAVVLILFCFSRNVQQKLKLDTHLIH